MMQPQTTGISKTRLWGGRVLGMLVVVFLVMEGGMKLFKPPFVVQATVQLGYPESAIVGIGVALLICTALYLIPRTAVLGAILLTGYLGGAVASNVRADTPIFNVVFPLILPQRYGDLWFSAINVRKVFSSNRTNRKAALSGSSG